MTPQSKRSIAWNEAPLRPPCFPLSPLKLYPEPSRNLMDPLTFTFFAECPSCHLADHHHAHPGPIEDEIRRVLNGYGDEVEVRRFGGPERAHIRRECLYCGHVWKTYD